MDALNLPCRCDWWRLVVVGEQTVAPPTTGSSPKLQLISVVLSLMYVKKWREWKGEKKKNKLKEGRRIIYVLSMSGNMPVCLSHLSILIILASHALPPPPAVGQAWKVYLGHLFWWRAGVRKGHTYLPSTTHHVGSSAVAVTGHGKGHGTLDRKGNCGGRQAFLYRERCHVSSRREKRRKKTLCSCHLILHLSLEEEKLSSYHYIHIYLVWPLWRKEGV